MAHIVAADFDAARIEIDSIVYVNRTDWTIRWKDTPDADMSEQSVSDTELSAEAQAGFKTWVTALKAAAEAKL